MIRKCPSQVPKTGLLDALYRRVAKESRPGGPRHGCTGAVLPGERWDRRKDLDEMVDPLAERHIVLSEEAQKSGRVLIVGDVHGCADELQDLLSATAFDAARGDTIILAGDVVNKGPKSVEALRLVRSLPNCYAILGNHELSALRASTVRRSGGSDSVCAAAAAAGGGSGGGGGVLAGWAWTDGLDEADLAYLRGLPYTIALPLHGAIVVHAGLVPGVPLEEQDRWNLVTLRNLIPQPGGERPWKGTEADAEGATAWAKQWPGPTHVYFGHDAKRELQVWEHATGLDTGCMYGKSLSAAILELGRPTEIVSVEARDVYAAPGYL